MSAPPPSEGMVRYFGSKYSDTQGWAFCPCPRGTKVFKKTDEPASFASDKCAAIGCNKSFNEIEAHWKAEMSKQYAQEQTDLMSSPSSSGVHVIKNAAECSKAVVPVFGKYVQPAIIAMPAHWKKTIEDVYGTPTMDDAMIKYCNEKYNVFTSPDEKRKDLDKIRKVHDEPGLNVMEKHEKVLDSLAEMLA